MMFAGDCQLVASWRVCMLYQHNYSISVYTNMIKRVRWKLAASVYLIQSLTSLLFYANLNLNNIKYALYVPLLF